MREISAYEHELGTCYYENVRRIPGVAAHGPDFSGPRAPTVSITVDGVPAAEVARALAEKGLQVWNGHFYGLRPLEVLELMESGGVVRAGVVMYNTREEVDRLLAAVKEVARR